LTTGAVSLQLGRRRLGQKNRVDEKVFVECNIQKESEAEPRGKRAFKVVN